MSSKSPLVTAEERHISVLRSFAETFGEPESIARAIALIESKSGFSKWYQRKYGYPLNAKLTVVKRALRDGTESRIAESAEAAGIAEQPVLLCSQVGIFETTLVGALLDAPTAPPLLLVSNPLAPSSFVLHWNEYLTFTFSLQLWSRLRMPTAHWKAQ